MDAGGHRPTAPSARYCGLYFVCTDIGHAIFITMFYTVQSSVFCLHAFEADLAMETTDTTTNGDGKQGKQFLHL